MRRFESTRQVRLRTAAGGRLDPWVAESFALRLTGLAVLAGLPEGRALLLPACRSVQTLAMRFAIDVAFLSWPPERRCCEVLALRTAVPPARVVAGPRYLPRSGVAALEARAGALACAGVRPGARLRVDPHEVHV
jgi:uncharacterized membrane protein (UPF0127 family)